MCDCYNFHTYYPDILPLLNLKKSADEYEDEIIRL